MTNELENCPCGCDAIPPEKRGGICVHCAHIYALQPPEDFEKAHDAHLAQCEEFQRYKEEGYQDRLKFWFEQRDASEPGSKEEDEMVQRILELAFEDRPAIRRKGRNRNGS